MTRDADGPIRDDELDALFDSIRGRRSALAVSGGLDSMVLLHLVGRWLAMSAPFEDCGGGATIPPPSDIGLPREAPELSARAKWLAPTSRSPKDAARLCVPGVVVLTVDHALRPGSADEAAFVADAAAALGLPHQSLVWRHATPPQADLPMTGLQEKARAARYDLMADAIEDELWTQFSSGDPCCHPLAGSAGRRMIVTAHHREDLVETFLMRLQRGSGLGGLAATRPVETFSRPPTPTRRYPSPIDIARPLLDVPRPRLLATARAANLAWREDPSNDDPRFERIRLRAAAPARAAQGLEPSSLHRTVRRLRAAREALEADCRRWIDGALETNGGLYAELVLRDPDRDSTRIDPDQGPSGEVLLGLLRHVICAFGGGHPEPELSRLEALVIRIERATASSLVPACTLGGCRISTDLSGDGQAIRVRVWRESGRAPLPELTLEPGDGGWWDNRFAVSVAANLAQPVTIRALGTGGWAELKRRAPALATWTNLPPGAAATLPAVWRGAELLAAPWFDDLAAAFPSKQRQIISDAWSVSYAAERNLYRIEFRPPERHFPSPSSSNKTT